jgi:hypothetical protein
MRVVRGDSAPVELEREPNLEEKGMAREHTPPVSSTRLRRSCVHGTERSESIAWLVYRISALEITLDHVGGAAAQRPGRSAAAHRHWWSKLRGPGGRWEANANAVSGMTF